MVWNNIAQVFCLLGFNWIETCNTANKDFCLFVFVYAQSLGLCRNIFSANLTGSNHSGCRASSLMALRQLRVRVECCIFSRVLQTRLGL